jgi:hypothetical protein
MTAARKRPVSVTSRMACAKKLIGETRIRKREGLGSANDVDLASRM